MTLDCTVCGAPLHPAEYGPHLKACVRISVGHGKTPAELAYADREAAFQRNAMANLPAWSPETHGPTAPIPQAVTPPEPPAHRPDPWGYYAGRTGTAVPEGKTKCLHCNGLSAMYPDCVNCDGKGWV